MIYNCEIMRFHSCKVNKYKKRLTTEKNVVLSIQILQSIDGVMLVLEITESWRMV